MAKKRINFEELYRNFYSSFLSIAHPNACHPPRLFFNSTKDDGSKIKTLSLTTPIYLHNWPVKKSRPAPFVDILIHADFDYEPKNFKSRHNRSSVCLTYIKRTLDGDTAIPIENLRFDYHPGAANDASHPFIHAHIFAKDKPNFEMPKEIKYRVNWDNLGARFDSFRLPTPNMTLPSVLCCLVACHLGEEKINALLKKTNRCRNELPGLTIEEKQHELLFDNSLAGSQWFLRA